MNKTTLDSLPVGRQAHISRLLLEGNIRRRMMDLGFVPGARVTALHESPCGDPVAYGIHGAVIALRRCDAQKILVE